MHFAIPLIRMTLLEAVRSRLAWIAFALAALGFGAAQYLSQAAIMEADAFRATVAAAFLRTSAVFLVVTFVITSMVREASDKITELLLSQPITRAAYLSAKLCGYAAVALVLGAWFTAPLALLVAVPHAILWGASLCCELLIMTAVSLFCVISLNQVPAAFAASAGFYLLARSIDSMRLIASAPLTPREGWTDSLVQALAEAISFLMPSLDRFSLSRWLVDAPPGVHEMASIAAQTLVYLALIGAASLFDLYRKDY